MAWLDMFDRNCRMALVWLAAKPARGAALLLLLCLALYAPGQASFPVTDRDEARFAQATKQMLESGDFIDIRFQDAPRYKKPAGIHWLQSLSVAAFGDGAERNAIWAYRIPSIIGVILAVLIAWWMARPIFGRETALLGAVLLAASVTVAFESRIAKSDAALFACVALAQWSLARIYILDRPRSQMIGVAAAFWIALGVGILIKGPVAPVVIGLSVAALAAFGGERRWMRNLHAAWGLPVMLTIALPWFIAIAVVSDGQFYQGAVGKDFLQKLIGGEEKHGAPPGYYFIAFWWSFWPGALIATGGAALWLWRHRVNRRATLLLCLIVPFWLTVEIVPTKLPHYIMPVYPAVAMAAAWVLRDQAMPGLLRMRTYKQGAALWLLVAALQVVAFGLAMWLFEAEMTASHAILAAIFALLAIPAAIAAWRARFHAALALAVASAAVLYLAAYPSVLPGLGPVWPAARALDAVSPFKACVDGPVAFSGYNEPSTVFLHGTRTLLVSHERAAEALATGQATYAFVAARRLERFEAELKARGVTPPAPIACAAGVDVNGGGALDMRLYALDPAVARCRPAPRYACGGKEPPRWRRCWLLWSPKGCIPQ